MPVKIFRKKAVEKVEEPEKVYSEFQKAMVPKYKDTSDPKTEDVKTIDPNWNIIDKVKAKAETKTPKEAREYLDRMANLWGPEVKTHQEIIKLIEDL